MAKMQEIYGMVLSELGRAAGRVTDEQWHRVLAGEARLHISVRRDAARDKRRRAVATVEFREDFPEMLEKFRHAKSVEECAVMVEYLLPTKAEMFAFAKYMHLPVQQKNGQKRIRDKIVDATAGSRIRSEIIRGGY